jgi:hypothetical protein
MATSKDNLSKTYKVKHDSLNVPTPRLSQTNKNICPHSCTQMFTAALFMKIKN